jgi:hypothetical protein
MHVAYVDESGKGDPLFVVGGVTAESDPAWLDFTEAWKTVLHLPPAIDHFHLADTQGLFKREHNAKIEALLSVVNTYVVRADLLIIHVEPYQRIFGGKLGATYDNPFLQGYISIFQQIATELPPDPEARIDFIYDEMTDTEYLELLHAYRSFKEQCPDPTVKGRLGAEPIRRKDTEALPLQAADLVAGLFLRAFKGDHECLEHLKRLTISNRAVEWDEPKLEQLFAKSVSPSSRIRPSEGPFLTIRRRVSI